MRLSLQMYEISKCMQVEWTSWSTGRIDSGYVFEITNSYPNGRTTIATPVLIPNMFRWPCEVILSGLWIGMITLSQTHAGGSFFEEDSTMRSWSLSWFLLIPARVISASFEFDLMSQCRHQTVLEEGDKLFSSSTNLLISFIISSSSCSVCTVLPRIVAPAILQEDFWMTGLVPGFKHLFRWSQVVWGLGEDF